MGVYTLVWCLASATWRLYSVVAYPPDEFIFGVNEDLVLGVGILVTAPGIVYAYWQWAAHEEEITS